MTSARWDCHTHIFGPWDVYPLAAAPTYVPEEAPFATLTRLHAEHGLTHGVIVQATPYGSDHRAMLDAMASSSDRYRGIAVIDANTPQATLERWHAAGVRGIRLGMMKHLAGKPDLVGMTALLARIRPHGWHALVHAELPDVLATVPMLADAGVTLVIDHMARVAPSDAKGLAALCALLARDNVWIKLSGADRITQSSTDLRAALPVMRALQQAAPDRTIWGSDWPHVNIRYSAPRLHSLLDLLADACANDAGALSRVLTDNPRRLYDGASLD